ncbi:hypothetical protein AN403_4413 [Pseudomonas fluorescens]|uniref:Uncharacterized protein n=1 Tax=Pseudomonas fluorescens TaxID=294 RepID=A0A0P8XTI9_PSEFL|nr:hypothetical protein AN403_4413 [Pseudomonas fluorescens]
MDVNDNACCLIDRVVQTFFASKLAPTGSDAGLAHCNALLNGNRAMFCAFSEPKYNQSPYSRTVVMGE